MFDLSYSLFIGPLFDPFMLSVCGGELGMSVVRGQGVKYSNVKVSSFNCSSPKTVGCMLYLAVLHPGGWLRHLSELPVTQVVIPALHVQTFLHTSVRRVAVR